MTVGAKVLMAAVIALAVPAVAFASSPKLHTVAPTPAQRKAILKAFGDPRSASPCLIARLAASNHGYATVRFRTRMSCRRWQFNGVNVIKRVRPRHWKVVFEASDYNCPVPRIPRRVQRDLGVCG